jgi:uncharacterized protein (TIGR03083 family)
VIDRDTVVDALIDEWAALDTLLTGLDDERWRLPTPCPGWSVADNLAHIVGTEETLAGRAAPAVAADREAWPHVRNELGASNERWVASMRADTPHAVLERFRRITAERAETLRTMPDEEFHAATRTPAGPATYARFMRIRVFDCWMHEQDIRDALGRPGGEDTPGAAVALDEMTESLGYLIGKRAGFPDGSSATVILTGPAARTLHVLVDGRARLVPELPHPATVTVTLPVGLFVRLCGGRVEPTDEVLAAARVTGDQELGRRLLGNLRFTP